MFSKISFLVLVINVFQNAAEIFIGHCFRLENTDMRVEVEFFVNITFIPDRMYIEFGTFDREFKSGKSYPRTRYNAVLLAEDCPGATFVFPNVFRQPGEKRLIEVAFYYGVGTDILLDRHEAVAWEGFNNITVPLFGFRGHTKISLEFSRKLIRFPDNNFVNKNYHVRVPRVKDDEFLCIRIFKSGDQMIFRLKGEGFLREEPFDSYRVEFSILKPLASSSESSQIFYAKSFICSEKYVVPVTQIYADPLAEMIRVTFYAYTGETLKAVYEKKDAGFSLNKEESTLSVDSISIRLVQPSYGQKSSSIIYLYPTQMTQSICYVKDEFSFVQIYRSNGMMLQRTGAVTDNLRVSSNVLTLRTATQLEIDKCLGGFSQH